MVERVCSSSCSWYLPSHGKSLSWWEACVALYHLSNLMHDHDMIFETELQQSWNFSGRNKMTITMLSLSFFTIFHATKSYQLVSHDCWTLNPSTAKGYCFSPPVTTKQFMLGIGWIKTIAAYRTWLLLKLTVHTSILKSYCQFMLPCQWRQDSSKPLT